MALSEHFDERKEEGYANGLAQGLSQGLSQGVTQGRVQGRAEERLAIAKLLLLQGVSMDIITKTTGLSEEEVRA